MASMQQINIFAHKWLTLQGYQGANGGLEKRLRCR